MKKYLPFILLLLLVPVSVNAQSLLTEWFNIPAEWTTPPNIIYYVFIPFLGTFAIIWGILTATRTPIFRNQRVNILISLVFTIALFYSSILPAIVLYLFTLGGFFGVLAFFVLFFVLTFLFGRRKIGAEYIKTLKAYDKAIGERKKEIDKITDSDKKKDALNKERKELVTAMESWEFAFNKIEGMLTDDPDIKTMGFSTKREALRHARDQMNKIKERIQDIDKELKRILNLKKKMREA